jgi:hypothetical protein
MATVDEPRTVFLDPEVHGTTRPLGRVHPGEELYLVAGPNVSGERQFWQVHPGPYDDETNNLGWVAATTGDGVDALIPLQLDCPLVAEGLTAAQLDRLGRLGSLSCFGIEELTLVGNVVCTNTVVGDGVIGGPMLDSYIQCQLDGLLWLYGDEVRALIGDRELTNEDMGAFQISGHFDDPGAQRCGRIPFGTDMGGARTPDPLSVITCRGLFVVSNLTPVT